jgi:putative toxin-antitoxin system antitoxin component (TIGR02293 family)
MIIPEKKPAHMSQGLVSTSRPGTEQRQNEPREKKGFLFFDQSDLSGIIKHINDGLPFSLFEQLCQKLQVSRTTLAKVLQFSLTTLKRGRERNILTPAESERLARILRLFDLCTLQLGSEDDARRWLTTPNRDLDWESPLEFSLHEFGARRVEDLIAGLESVSADEQ